MEEEQESNRTQPDVASLSRFAMTTGTLILVYVIGGGVVQKDWTSNLIPLRVTHPELLVLFFAAVSVYGAWRYWYYAVRLRLTRTSKRQYFKSPKSVLAISSESRESLRETITIDSSRQLNALTFELKQKILPGMVIDDAIVYAGGTKGSTSAERVQAEVAREMVAYFPYLDASQVTCVNATGDPSPRFAYWASVSPKNIKTIIHCCLEDADLYAPLWVNAVGLILLSASWLFCWPSSMCVLGGN